MKARTYEGLIKTRVIESYTEGLACRLRYYSAKKLNNIVKIQKRIRLFLECSRFYREESQRYVNLQRELYDHYKEEYTKITQEINREI